MLKKLIKIAIYPIIALSLHSSLYVQAQERNEEVTIIAPYQPTIISADKINFAPDLLPEEATPSAFEYTALTKKINTSLTLSPINPVKPRRDKDTELKKNYVKAGFGNYLTPYLEFFANNLQSGSHSLGVKLNHISSNGGIDNYAYSGYSHSGISAYGKKFFKKHTLGGALAYRRDIVHHYGFQTDVFPGLEVEKDDIRQRFQDIAGQVSFESKYLKSNKLNHAFGLDFYHLDDIYGSRENSADFKIGMNREFDFAKIEGKHLLGLKANFKYVGFTDSLKSLDRTLIRFEPYYKLAFNQYTIYAGVDISGDLDSLNTIHIYPLLRGDIIIVKDALSAYAGIRGSLQMNTFKSVSMENPFIVSVFPFRNTNNKFEAYGGVKGSLSLVDYFAEISNATVEDLLMFVNDTSLVLENQFTAVYDDVNVTRISLGFTVSKIKNFSFTLRGSTYLYSTHREENAWQLPANEISLLARYNFLKKYSVTGEFYWFGNRIARTFENNQVVAAEMTGGLDLNLGFSYRVTPDLTAFIKVRNLTGNQYQKWYNYPVQGVQLMLGISYSF